MINRRYLTVPPAFPRMHPHQTKRPDERATIFLFLHLVRANMRVVRNGLLSHTFQCERFKLANAVADGGKQSPATLKCRIQLTRPGHARGGHDMRITERDRLFQTSSPRNTSQSIAKLSPLSGTEPTPYRASSVD
jgi:hypothetical protein